MASLKIKSFNNIDDLVQNIIVPNKWQCFKTVMPHTIRLFLNVLWKSRSLDRMPWIVCLSIFKPLKSREDLSLENTIRRRNGDYIKKKIICFSIKLVGDVPHPESAIPLWLSILDLVVLWNILQHVFHKTTV